MASYDYSKIAKEIRKEVEGSIREEISNIDLANLISEIMAEYNIDLGTIDIKSDNFKLLLTKTIQRVVKGSFDDMPKIEIDLDDFVDLDESALNKKVAEFYDAMEDAFDRGDEKAAKSIEDNFVKAISTGLAKGYKIATDMMGEYNAKLSERMGDLGKKIKSQGKAFFDPDVKGTDVKYADSMKNELTARARQLQKLSNQVREQVVNMPADLEELKQFLMGGYSETGKAQKTTYWNSIIENFDQLSLRTKKLLKDFGLLNKEGLPSVIIDGANNYGGLIGELNTAIVKTEPIEAARELKNMLDQAADSGVQCARILEVIESGIENVTIELQQTAKGNPLSVVGDATTNYLDIYNVSALKASQEQVQKLYNDVKKLWELGLEPDIANPSNLLYDKKNGFTILDVSAKHQYASLEEQWEEFKNNMQLNIQDYADNGDINVSKAMASFSEKLANVGQEVGTAFVGGFRQGIDAHSDSKEMVDAADDAINGIVHEVEARLPEVEQSGESLGEHLVAGLEKELQDAKDRIEGYENQISSLSAELNHMYETTISEGVYDYETDRLQRQIETIRGQLSIEREKTSELERQKELLDQQQKTKSDGIFDSSNTTALVDSLEKISSLLEDIRNTLGTIDDNSGFKNLITSIDELMTKLQAIQEKVGTGVYNISVTQGTSKEAVAATQSTDAYIKSREASYRSAYEKVVARAGDEEKLFAAINNAVGLVGGISELQSAFSALSVTQIQSAEERIQRYIRFFDLLRQAMSKQALQGFSRDENNKITQAEWVKAFDIDLSGIRIPSGNDSAFRAGLKKRSVSSKTESEMPQLEDDSQLLKEIVSNLESIRNILNDIVNNNALGEAFGDAAIKLNGLSDAINDIKNAFSDITLNPNIELKDGFQIIQNEAQKTVGDLHMLTDELGHVATFYRGLRNSMGQGLVSDRFNGATFWTDSFDLAKEYSQWTKVESANLSMLRPLEIEGNGANWDAIEYLGNGADEASKKILKAKETLNEITKDWAELINEGYDIKDLTSEHGISEFKRMIDEQFSSSGAPEEIRQHIQETLAALEEAHTAYRQISDDMTNVYGKHTTNEFVELAQKNGFDGVIFKNIVDSMSGVVKEATNVVVQFNEDRIRFLETISASDNLNERDINAITTRYAAATGRLNQLEQSGRTQMFGYDSEDEKQELQDIIASYERLLPLLTQYKERLIEIYNEDDSTWKSKRDEINQEIYDKYANPPSEEMEKQTKINEAVTEEIELQKQKTAEIQEQNNLLQTQNDLLREQSQISIVGEENNSLDVLREKLNGIIEAINVKSQAFIDEGNTVDEVVQREVTSLEQLRSVLNNIATTSDADETSKESNAFSGVRAVIEEIQEAIGTKNNLLAEEFALVAKEVPNEIELFQSLNEILDTIAQRITTVMNGIQTISKSKIVSDANKEAQKTEAAAKKQQEKEAAQEKRRQEKEAAKRQKEAEKLLKQLEQEEQSEIDKDSRKVVQYYAKLEKNEKQYQQLVAKRNAGIDLTSSEAATLRTLRNQREEEQGILDVLKERTDEIEQARKGYEAIVLKERQSAELAVRESLQNDITKRINAIRTKADSGKYTALSSSLARQRINNIQQNDYVNETDVKTLTDYVNLLNQTDKSFVKVGNNTKLVKLLNDVSTTIAHNSKMSGELRSNFDALGMTLQRAIDTGASQEEVQALTRRFLALKNEMTATGQEGKSFADMIKNDIGQASARMIAQYMSFQDWIRYIRNAVGAVTELDSALNQLKIISNSTDEALQGVATGAYELANSLGMTTTEVVSSITEWKRLGYSMEDSMILAEQAARLSTGGMMDINAATTSLISSMQAFEIGADEVGKVVDQYIYLGNNYAISSEQLATSLTKSMAALKVAGNSLEEIEALEIAGNTMVQDADVISNALKVNIYCLHIEKSICYAG